MSPAKKKQPAKKAVRESAAEKRRRINLEAADARFDATGLGEAFHQTLGHIRSHPGWSDKTRAHYDRTARILRENLMSRGLMDTAEVSFDLLQAFVDAPNDDGSFPAEGTMCGRATVCNLTINGWFREELLESNPLFGRTLRVPRTTSAIRHISDAEVQKCWLKVNSSSRTTRPPAVFGLGLAGGFGSEITLLEPPSIDLGTGRVIWPGCKCAEPRITHLTPEGLEAVATHLESPVESPKRLGSIDRRTFGGLTSINDTFARVLKKAGLWGPEEIRIGSVRLWAGAHELENTGRIEDAAYVMGVRSLDRAAELLNYHWPFDGDDH